MNKLAYQQRKLITYFKHSKEKLTSLETKSSELMTENHKLKIRAAVVWEELTPRPDLTPIMKILGLEPSFYKDKGSKQIANDLTEHINNRIKTTVDRSSNFIRIKRSRTKTTKEKNDNHLEVPLRSSKTHVKTKSKSSHSGKNSLGSIIEKEENKIDIKKIILSTVDEFEMKEILRAHCRSEKLSPKSIGAMKRRFLMSLEKNDDFRKMRSVSPHKNFNIRFFNFFARFF